ncbi:hypothetical protein E2C01_084461 [Portunus trituberculatus]|uniref:Uncharacterized protein n=1 Tax=Portunus trituberculatus TaxID=210409 RepID=A0A5B7IYB8_PORTR|nr:hypothetical protein [Portunus trituberculatus]
MRRSLDAVPIASVARPGMTYWKIWRGVCKKGECSRPPALGTRRRLPGDALPPNTAAVLLSTCASPSPRARVAEDSAGLSAANGKKRPLGAVVHTVHAACR